MAIVGGPLVAVVVLIEGNTKMQGSGSGGRVRRSGAGRDRARALGPVHSCAPARSPGPGICPGKERLNNPDRHPRIRFEYKLFLKIVTDPLTGGLANERIER
jgi:hypothetical protein